MNNKFLVKIVASLILIMFLALTGCKKSDAPTNQDGSGTVTDHRDGQIYKTITIDNQVWFAQNLNYAAQNSSCFNYISYNGDTYGRLYSWDAALTACPDGWHLPNDEEWKTLEIFLGMSQVETGQSGFRGSDEGKKLKSTSAGLSGWLESGNGTNDIGFSALPGGYHSSGDHFDYLGTLGAWWTSTEYSSTGAWSRSMDCWHDQISRNNDTKIYGFSVRCVKANGFLKVDK